MLPPARRRLVRALFVAMAVVAAVFVVSTVPGVRGTSDAVFWLDGLVRLAFYVLAAALLGLRPLLVARARPFWVLLAASLAARVVGFLFYLPYAGGDGSIPTPSPIDALWLCASSLVIASFVVLAGRSTRRPTLGVGLDALTGVLVLAAVAVAFVHAPLLELLPAGSESLDAVFVLAFPSLDVAVVIAFVGVLATTGWRLSGPLVWLALGTVGHALLGILRVFTAMSGTSEPGGLLSALALLSVAMLPIAAWVRPGLERRERRDVAVEPEVGIALPLAFGGAGWALLVYAALNPVPVTAVVLVSLGVGVALIRTGWSFTLARSLGEQRRLARTDDLTGLGNRRAVLEALEDQRPGAGLGVLALDLDGFRSFNETVGHDQADVLLQVVARRLQESTRDIDVTARLGADDFVVLLPNADEADLEEAAERIGTSIRRPIDLGSTQRTLTASVGLAIAPEDGTDPDDLLRKSELALEDVKRNRTGPRRFDPARHRTESDRRKEVDQLLAGIHDGQLRMHYQPIIDLAGGGMVGVEALVRWQHPERGLLPPVAFLPLAESAGLMRDLFGEVLRQATAQTAAWHARGYELGLALNVSVTDLLDPDLPGQVADALAAHGLRGHHLVLELTEEVFLAEPHRAAAALARLWDHEVGLTIDDYGTGYSSLSYLRDLEALQGLKLDRTFVDGLDVDPRAQAIVASTLELAYLLDLEVVAEGIETPAVHRHLRDLGCPLGQGHYFSRPVPADELALEATFDADDQA